MAILEILTYPHPLLRTKARLVETVDDEIHETIEDMAATMYDAPGSGLAAVQVGIDKSILVYDISGADEEPSLRVLINPTIVSREGETINENEGCLSIPEYRADVKRASRVCVDAWDREGKQLCIDNDGYLAIVLQHEIDHLNGILFIDHLTPLKREMYKRRLKKQQRMK